MQKPKLQERVVLNAVVFLTIAVVSIFQPTPTIALSRPAALCEFAARDAAQKIGVPVQVMRAIAHTETGRSRRGSLEPWAWTVNMEGKGVWFETLREARSFVLKHMERGATSFDIGCFQINYKWHGQAFASIEAMFDPKQNAVYAARYLRSLFDELGNWSDAAAAYHSRTPKHALRYKARFEQILAHIPDASMVPNEEQLSSELPRDNTFPFLTASSGATHMGSLVPTATKSRRSLFSNSDLEN